MTTFIDDRVEPEIRRRDPVRVLVADDDDEMRKLMALMLRRYGYDVIEFHDGTQLHHYVRGLSSGTIRVVPHAIVSDIRMPGLSGLQLLRDLHSSALHIPTILVTGFGDAHTHAAAKRLGAVTVLDKPFPFGRLRQEVVRIAPMSL